MVEVQIRLPQPEDVDALYPMLVDSTVTDTICWDGPPDLATYRKDIAKRIRQVASGEVHLFTIVADGEPAGMIDARPYDEPEDNGDVGLWIGEPYWGQGVGTAAVELIVGYARDVLGMRRIEAKIFVGNEASKRIFEKNGFALEGTLRQAIVKRGVPTDEWLMARVWPL